MESEAMVVIYEQEVLGKDFKVYGTKEPTNFGTFENPLFLAKEVAEWIEHKQVARMMELVDEDEKLMCPISTSGQSREMWFLTEDGVYEVLMQSRKPIAKQFKKEVKKILKEIRLKGYYAPKMDIPIGEELGFEMPNFNNILEVIGSFGKLLSSWANLKQENIKLSEKVKALEEDNKKLVSSSGVNLSESNIDIGAFACVLSTKIIRISRNKLFAWLRDNHYIYKLENYNLPFKRHIEEGLFVVTEYTCFVNGALRTNKKTLITPKGQALLANIIRNDFVEKQLTNK